MTVKCKRDGGPMAETHLRDGSTHYQCVVCGRSFIRKPAPKPVEDATAPLRQDETNRWWHS